MVHYNRVFDAQSNRGKDINSIHSLENLNINIFVILIKIYTGQIENGIIQKMATYF
jgi:hypothetical protein